MYTIKKGDKGILVNDYRRGKSQLLPLCNFNGYKVRTFPSRLTFEEAEDEFFFPAGTEVTYNYDEPIEVPIEKEETPTSKEGEKKDTPKKDLFSFG